MLRQDLLESIYRVSSIISCYAKIPYDYTCFLSSKGQKCQARLLQKIKQHHKPDILLKKKWIQKHNKLWTAKVLLRYVSVRLAFYFFFFCLLNKTDKNPTPAPNNITESILSKPVTKDKTINTIPNIAKIILEFCIFCYWISPLSFVISLLFVIIYITKCRI